MAGCFALIDEKEKAIDWLDNAMHRGFINYPFLVRLDPFLETLREEAAFDQLMDQIKQRCEAFEV